MIFAHTCMLGLRDDSRITICKRYKYHPRILQHYSNMDPFVEGLDETEDFFMRIEEQ
jgi:hypothetical protein